MINMLPLDLKAAENKFNQGWSSFRPPLGVSLPRMYFAIQCLDLPYGLSGCIYDLAEDRWDRWKSEDWHYPDTGVKESKLALKHEYKRLEGGTRFLTWCGQVMGYCRRHNDQFISMQRQQAAKRANEPTYYDGHVFHNRQDYEIYFMHGILPMKRNK